MPGRTIVQWDKNDLDALGFVRVDILGLGIMTAIRKSFQYLEETYGKTLTLATVPAEDPAVYQQICDADTVGVFQIESRAQMNMLPRLQPRNFFDLVVEISLVRPGPIQGEMVHPYLRRRSGLEAAVYPHPELESILKKTYGVPLFQEQIMKMALVAGFTPGEADELRRAMGTWRRHGGNRLTLMGERFKAGLIKKGISQGFAEKVFSQIEGFAEYGFPESHAASFAILAYVTAYLKHHYPDVYLTALLNSQPMGFYSSHSLIHDGMRHGVRVKGIDANVSRWDNTLVAPKEIVLGMREIKGFAKRVGLAIEKARESGPFSSFGDFLERVESTLRPIPLTKRDLFLLAGANAFSIFSLVRRQAWWQIQALSLPDSRAFSSPEAQVLLPEEEGWENIVLDYEAQGVSLTSHPMAHLRLELSAQGVTPSVELKKIKQGKSASAAGMVICRQMPPTASGVLFYYFRRRNRLHQLGHLEPGISGVSHAPSLPVVSPRGGESRESAGDPGDPPDRRKGKRLIAIRFANESLP